MKEAINHRHNEGDDGDGDHKHHQAAPCPHFLVVRQSSSASRFTAGAFGFLTFTQCRNLKNPRRRPIWNAYCFICGSTFLVGVNFEPLWVRFTDMYIL